MTAEGEPKWVAVSACCSWTGVCFKVTGDGLSAVSDLWFWSAPKCHCCVHPCPNETTPRGKRTRVWFKLTNCCTCESSAWGVRIHGSEPMVLTCDCLYLTRKDNSCPALSDVAVMTAQLQNIWCLCTCVIKIKQNRFFDSKQIGPFGVWCASVSAADVWGWSFYHRYALIGFIAHHLHCQS